MAKYSVLVKKGIGWRVEATYGKREHALEREAKAKAAGYKTRIISHAGDKPVIRDLKW